MTVDWIGRIVRVRSGGQILQGQVIGMLASGILLVRPEGWEEGSVPCQADRVLWWTCCLPRTRTRLQRLNPFAVVGG